MLSDEELERIEREAPNGDLCRQACEEVLALVSEVRRLREATVFYVVAGSLADYASRFDRKEVLRATASAGRGIVLESDWDEEKGS